MGTTLSYLPLLYNSSGLSGSPGGLLDIAQGRGATGKNLGGAGAILALRTAERDQARQIATTAKEPQVARDIAAFRAGVAKAKTPAELLANPAVMKVLLTANGLGDQIPYAALARKALLSNLSDSHSLANRLTDTRWKSTAQTYDFAKQGLAVIANPSVLNTLSSAYAEITWRKSLDATTPGLSDALNFRDRAGKITSAVQILGDPVLRRVVTTALGLPLEIALQSLPAQEKAITARLDIKRLADPKFVETFAQRYLLAAADKAKQATASPDLITLAGQSAGLVI